MASWDVVNEAVDDDRGLRGDVFAKVLGPGYVADAVHALVAGLVRDGVPIDGVGFQAHVTAAAPLRSMTSTMDRFAALGLATPVTEGDVRLDDDAGPEALEDQARVYRRLVEACLRARDCPSFTTRGVRCCATTASRPNRPTKRSAERCSGGGWGGWWTWPPGPVGLADPRRAHRSLPADRGVPGPLEEPASVQRAP